MKKRWKQFRDSNYCISDIGEVRNKHGKILKAVMPGVFKYKSYALKVNGKTSGFFEHRLVAECFVRNRNGGEQVNHKDGNKLNNHYKNLEWLTRAENIQHMYDTGLKTYKPLHYKGKFGSEHNRSKAVKCIETGEVYGSMSEAGRKLNICHSSVSWSIKYKAPIYGKRFELA